MAFVYPDYKVSGLILHLAQPREDHKNGSSIVPNSKGKTLLLLKPRGFCAGVVRAIDVVRIALEAFGPPIYVRKEIVHNRFVVDELRGKVAIFDDYVDEVTNAERIISRTTSV